eukprot:CAMPEP_0201216116 /NCGR_PEP_ID=MMETSP0851-20130426/189340_1 /ASSEMBLY_ACC=CAM_ASM_000631 /TAXON_ID=183588 /ORGANISM="Pseudo-nitzschia fraudulenta, Strain WWA7" /LENGTH=152 /DNA_ID=CAMNT_0047505651 /DNA_START=172 /DNA_END=631 /DNA_ORIENTATION=+
MSAQWGDCEEPTPAPLACPVGALRADDDAPSPPGSPDRVSVHGIPECLGTCRRPLPPECPVGALRADDDASAPPGSPDAVLTLAHLNVLVLVDDLDLGRLRDGPWELCGRMMMRLHLRDLRIAVLTLAHLNVLVLVDDLDLGRLRDGPHALD